MVVFCGWSERGCGSRFLLGLAAAGLGDDLGWCLEQAVRAMGRAQLSPTFSDRVQGQLLGVGGPVD